MPLGFTNPYLMSVDGTAYDLRRVTRVSDHQTDPTLVNVAFTWDPTLDTVFVRADFEAAYEAVLIVLGG